MTDVAMCGRGARKGSCALGLAMLFCLLACSAENSDADESGRQNGAVAAAGTGSSGAGGTPAFGNSTFDASLSTGEPPVVVDEMGCAAVSQTATARKAPSDIIWAVDTSASLQVARDTIQAELNEFSQRIVAAGIDAHIVLLASTDANNCFGPGFSFCVPPPLGSGQCGGGALAVTKVGLGASAFCPSVAVAGMGADSTATFLHLNAASGETMQLDTILAQYDAYKSMLRPEAKKHFVITSDGDGRQSAAEFSQALAQLSPTIPEGTWDFSAVYCKAGCAPTCLGAATVTYPALVASTMGVDGSLCDGQPAFTGLLDKLVTAVIVGAQLSCEWEIPPPPMGETFDKGKVNVAYQDGSGKTTSYDKIAAGSECGDHDGWQYDDEDNPTKIHVCPKTCEAIQKDEGGRMDLQFGCETRVIVPD